MNRTWRRRVTRYSGLLSVALTMFVNAAFAFDLDAELPRVRESFDYLHRAVTGKAPAPDTLDLVVDASVSRTGNDAYRIESKGTGVRLTGSNVRSLLYAVYDLFRRRAGCRYFWDGDILPRVGHLDLSGLDVSEEARFRYRGYRYFGHRGLTRFQAEHWGFEDWKRELDWLAKNRQNVFFSRLGMDDLFPRTFPEACSYPDASQPLPGQGEGYDNRSLFWSLEYRGELRRRVLAYARSLGIAFPEDFGTITHWYTRTPQDFLDHLKPDFLPQATKVYSEPSGLIWDIRQPKWLEAYWALTETAIREYGSPAILHTQGFSERRCFEDRAKNLQMKREMNAKMFALAAKYYPKSPVFLNSWDFWHNWTMEETRDYIKTLDKNQVILLDFCLNAPDRGPGDSQFRNWDVIGKFPYMVGPFRCEPITMIHEDYELLEKRFAPARDDPMCVGFLDWTENSHPDALQIKYQVENSWRPRRDGIGALVDELCRDRYADQRELLAGIWKDVVAIAPKVGRCTDVDALWVQSYAQCIQSFASSFAGVEADHRAHPELWKGVGLETFRTVPEIFRRLADVKWRDEFVKRDAMDLARGAADRLIIEMTFSIFDSYFAWRQGNGSPARVLRLADAYLPLVELMEKLLQLHKDYSLADTYDHMEAIEHIRNPNFDQVLIENANCWYCVSHQAECARHFTTPVARLMIERLKAQVRSGDRTGALQDLPVTELRQAMRTRRLDEIRPVEPRSEANWRQTMLDFAAAARPALATEPVALKYEDYIYGVCDHAVPVYRPGETMTFTFKLSGPGFEKFDASGCKFDWKRTGDDGKCEQGTAPADRPLVLRTSLDRPGYVRYFIVLRDAKGTAVRREAGDEVTFDGGAGVDVGSIRPAVAAPADFEDFWAKRKAELRKVAWRERVEKQSVPSPLPEVELWAVSVPCAGGRPVTGYLSVPVAAKRGQRFPAALHYYGYGESWTDYAYQPPSADRLAANRIDFFVTAHGFELRRPPEYYRQLRASLTHHPDGLAFDPTENADPDKAYFCGMTYRVMRAAEFVKAESAWNRRDLLAEGASMGGLQSIWTAALDPEVTECRPDIPWCCDIGGTRLGRNRGDWYVKWTPALGYYDPVNMATLINPKCRLFIPRLGLGDYICPPTGVTAFYNRLRCVKGAHGFQNTTHGYVSPRPRQMFALRGDRVVEFRDGDPLVAPSKWGVR